VRSIRKDGKELDLLDLNARRNLDFGIDGGVEANKLLNTQ
jgi:hypothetical protein